MTAPASVVGASTKGLTGVIGATAVAGAVTSTVQGIMDIHAGAVNLKVHKANLDSQPPTHLQIPPISPP
jgi:hypothetical protein